MSVARLSTKPLLSSTASFRSLHSPKSAESERFTELDRVAWPFRPVGSPTLVTGLDVMVAANGRITALYTFVDPQKNKVL
jgi:hypothetical protein